MLYLRKLLFSGWKPKTPIYLRKKILFSFQTLIVSLLISIFYIPVGIFTKVEIIYQLAIINVLFSVFCLIILNFKYYNFSRIIFLIYLNLTLFFASSHLGISFGIHIFFSTVFVLPLLVFDIKEKRKIQFSMFLTLLCIFLLVLSNFSLFKSDTMIEFSNSQEIQNISTINFTLSTITLGLAVSYLVNVSSEKEKQLRISSVSHEESRINMQTLIGNIQAAEISSRNITERKQTERNLKESRENLTALISSLDDIVFEIDEYEVFLSVWTKDESVLFFPKETFIGKRYDEVLPIEISQKIKEGMEKLRQTDNTVIVEYYNEIKGKVNWYNAKLNHIKNDNSPSNRISVLVRDITEKKKTEAETFKAKEIAEKAKLSESQFLSNMSHEIRTPLYAVIGLTDLLLKEVHSNKVREHLNIIKYSADNLLLIVNDILDFSKIESGSFSFDKLEFSISSLIQNLLKTIEITAVEKKLKLEKNIDDNVPKILIGDSLRLNQILLNLVSNAIKFTNSGFVKIVVESESFSKNQVLVTFQISDSGIGIPKEEQKLIFQSFFQVKGTEKKYGGTGLGLAITKRLVEMQNGSITLKSSVGEGTTFTVKIPYNVGMEISEKNTRSDSKKNLSGLRVLIVDDFELNRIVGEEILSAWNITVAHAEDGNKALKILEKESFDLILMDMQMPSLNGDEVANIIRNPSSKVKDHLVPIIALSADVFPETEQAAFQSGINDFIRKPFIPDQLYESILKNVNTV
ncbi:MAG: response regulator [Leptospiraceae bacterium]|nr:response regulator [Leptospiraceae bacterium]